MDVVYAALTEGMDGEQRQALDVDLGLPLGETRESRDKARRQAMADAGWM